MYETARPAEPEAGRPLEDPNTLLVSRMLATAERFRLFTPGQCLLVAVSGGPDSTALLHALAHLSAAWNLTLVAAHLNHGFRGEESEAEAHYITALCDRLAIPCHVKTEDVPARKRRQHLSSQEAARRARHGFLLSVADKTGADHIALGHTRDDRVETILLNILRGTGTEGLAALPPSHDRTIRPLIAITRSETLAYCHHHDLAPRTDSSNSNLDYRRNRLRSELLPYLATYYNERIDDALLRFSDIVSAENTLLEEMAAAHLETVMRTQSRDAIVLDAERLSALPIALRRRVLRMAIQRLRGHLQGVGFEVLERILVSAGRGESASVDLPATEVEVFRLRADGKTVTILRGAPHASPLPWRVVLNSSAEIVLPGGEWSVQSLAPGAWNCGGTEAAVAASLTTEHLPIRLVFSRDRLKFPLVVRNWRPGDRMQLPGLHGAKKLQDLFTDRKVPIHRRSRTPVLVDADGRVLAVAGLAVEDTQVPFLSGEVDWKAVLAENEKYVVIVLRSLAL